MSNWSKKWKLKFHPTKCKVMTLGSKIAKYPYILEEHELEYVDKESDLGLIIDDKLKFENHIESKINKANKIMGLIMRLFSFLDKDMFSKLFKSMVRPHLEFSHPTWYPITKKLKIQIENVQRRASKKVEGLTNLSYEERLEYLKLPCLLYRRIRGDVIEVYKMLHHKYDDELEIPLNLHKSTKATRGTHKLSKTKFHKNTRKYFFKNRVVNVWNRLPDDIKGSNSINILKNKLIRCYQGRGSLK